ncbi:MAG: hypothetical protein PHV06_06435, partial [bacterium]|nr:hypothetical protein [bacterium]
KEFEIYPEEIRFFINKRFILIETKKENLEFKLWMLPRKKFPPFPFKKLVNQYSYFTDETGVIKRIKADNISQKCPENSPEFRKVNPLFINAANGRLLQILSENDSIEKNPENSD